MDRRIFKKDEEELEEYLQFRRRGSRVDSKKGKGSVYKRSRKNVEARDVLEEALREEENEN